MHVSIYLRTLTFPRIIEISGNSSRRVFDKNAHQDRDTNVHSSRIVALKQEVQRQL